MDAENAERAECAGGTGDDAAVTSTRKGTDPHVINDNSPHDDQAFGQRITRSSARRDASASHKSVEDCVEESTAPVAGRYAQDELLVHIVEGDEVAVQNQLWKLEGEIDGRMSRIRELRQSVDSSTVATEMELLKRQE